MESERRAAEPSDDERRAAEPPDDERDDGVFADPGVSSDVVLPPWLPDIGVFGPYTYLVTEVAFGSVAFALLWRANALRRAGKTILALYPIAFVWDWYTLQVGVFAIELRTGVDLLGIPIEEHVFMVVVPALIVGMHETIHGGPAEQSGVGHGDSNVGE